MKKNANNTHHKEKKEKLLNLSGTFLYYDVKNENNRIYSKKIAKEIIKQFNKKRKKTGNFFGELGYSENFEINLFNISHDVEEINLNEETKSIEGTIKILNTPAGEKAKKLLDKNNLTIRPRGYGDVNEKGEIENFEVISFDLIDPKTDAFKNIKENDFLIKK